MDECLSGNHTCDLNASCLNSKGSYTCHCNDEYNGDGVTCIDVDECSGVNTCSDNSSCKNNVIMIAPAMMDLLATAKNVST